MTQAHGVLAATVAALGGIALGLGSVLALMFARGDRPGPPAPGAVATGFRYCPVEMRTRAAVVHPDGSATCADCNTHIPTTESVKGGR